MFPLGSLKLKVSGSIFDSDLNHQITYIHYFTDSIVLALH